MGFGETVLRILNGYIRGVNTYRNPFMHKKKIFSAAVDILHTLNRVRIFRKNQSSLGYIACFYCVHFYNVEMLSYY